MEETEAAGRVIAVDPDGVAEIEVTGLSWRSEVSQKKNTTAPSFRLRNRTAKSGYTAIRFGDNGIPRSVTLPGLGTIRV